MREISEQTPYLLLTWLLEDGILFSIPGTYLATYLIYIQKQNEPKKLFKNILPLKNYFFFNFKGYSPN